MADRIFGAVGCNKSELKLVKREAKTIGVSRTGGATTTRAER